MISTEAKVGSFVLAGMALIAVAIFLLGDYTFEKRYSLFVTFRDVASLSKNAPVKLSGVEIGTVKEILLEDGQAKVVAAIRDGVVIFKDAEFEVGSTGIIGSKFLQISQGHPAAGAIFPETVVRGVDPVSLEKAMTKALGSLEELLDSLGGKNAKPGTLASNLNETVANLRDLTGNLNDLIETSRPQLSKAMNRTDAITDKLDSLLAKSNQMMAGLSTDKGAVGAMLHDEKVKEDVKETISSFKEAAGTAKDVLGRITQFRVYWNLDWRYEHLIKAGRGDVGLKIYPRDGRYYYLGGANLGGGTGDFKKERDFAQYNRVDGLLGWERGPFDVAAGVIHSAGGARVTVTPFWKHPFGKRFSLLAQAYDFGRDRIVESKRFDSPVYDFGVMARVNRYFGLGGRVEDVKEVKRYQTWVNVSFEDQDVAYLFGMVSFGAAGSKGRSKK